jgi:hypothetical protein
MTSEIAYRNKPSDVPSLSDIADTDNGMTATRRTTSLAHGYFSHMGIGNITVLVVLLLLLAAAVVVASIGWSLGDAADVPVSGYVALALGVVLSLAVGFGLMTLVFFSSRKGYDEPPVLLPPDASDPT